MGLRDWCLVVRRCTSQIYVLDAPLFSRAWRSGFRKFSEMGGRNASARPQRRLATKAYRVTTRTRRYPSHWRRTPRARCGAGLTRLAYALPDSETSSCDLTELDASIAPSQNSQAQSNMMNNDFRGFPATARLMWPWPVVSSASRISPAWRIRRVPSPISISTSPSRFTTSCRRGAV